MEIRARREGRVARFPPSGFMQSYASITIEPGVVLAGKYRIERVLGQGGMGVVAAAYHLHLEQRVALKLMLPHAMASGESVSRFLREARAAARITSDHVARVFDVGTLDTGAPYIAMEYLEGADLSQLLASRGRLPVDEAVEYLLQACEALAEAHSVGIVHRDLKPGNLYLAQRVDGQRLIKVLDFGISKMSGASAQSDALATRTSALMGSPLYMSPEQMGSSRDVDARSDIWALGVVLHELLSGSPPFDGETLPQVCARVMSEPPPPLHERAPGLPPAVYDVVSRCLQKLPAARFQSIAELAHALEPIASGRARQSVERISRVLGVKHSPAPTVVQTPVAATTADPVFHPPSTQANWGDTQPKPVVRRSPAPLLGGLLAGLAIAGGAAYFVIRAPSVNAQLEPATSVAGSTQQPAPPAVSEPAVPTPAPPAVSPPARAEAVETAVTAASSAPPPGVARAPQPASRPAPARAPKAPPEPAAKAAPAAVVPAQPAQPAQPPASTTTRSRL
jgi:eukaryotic-like serine/threonine-protein kinase